MGLKVGEGNRTHPVMSKQRGYGLGSGVRARRWEIRLGWEPTEVNFV